jgi:hypothetical protein
MADMQWYKSVEFTKLGEVHQPAQIVDIVNGAKGVTDLFIASHGWNNDKNEAEELYDGLFENVTRALGSPSDRSFAVAKVYWPSKRFAIAEEDVAGGGASLDASVEIGHAFDQLSTLYDAEDDAEVLQAIGRCKALATSATTQNEETQDEIGRLFRALMPSDANDEEPLFNERFLEAEGPALLRLLGARRMRTDGDLGGAAVIGAGDTRTDEGGAAGLGSWIGNGIMGGLNVLTYWKMKERAGAVGARGVAPLLRQLMESHPRLRIHLVGHSFGCRAMAAALAAGEDDRPIRVSSACLLQAAFSQFGFSTLSSTIKRDGHFRKVVSQRRVKGVMVVTHSKRDRAVGWAYPAASRFSHDDASAFGSEDDRFGALGSNGARHTPEAQDAQFVAEGVAYGFDASSTNGSWIYNLDGGNVISKHSDVRNARVAHAVACAALASTD